MMQPLFLYYGWFLQNLEKGCIRTNMHTTVNKYISQTYAYSDQQANQVRLKQQEQLRICQTALNVNIAQGYLFILLFDGKLN